ncbi:MAG: hypothetical protein EXR98_05455 [Gemmataceae bacterium]|nr:hypothetical protein [Gemmataceae bacterium]
MEIVQLQCGNCQQLMAIGVEHLGGQVQCPHCQAVVQTQAAAPAPAPNMQLELRERTFSGAAASDVVLGNAPAPQVEMPPGPIPPDVSVDTPAANPEFTKFKSRPVYSSGVFSLIALIFLVPYAIVMTAFVVYLVFFVSKSAYDPLDVLRDPVNNPKGGAPRKVMQVDHKHPLAAHLKTTFGKPIQIGDLLVTFERASLTDEGDLRLFLRAKNVSTNTAFEPMNEAFVHAKGGELYTYLESKSNTTGRLFGAYLDYHKNLQGTDDAVGSAVLSPKDEILIVLKTEPHYKKQIAQIAKATDSYTWRIQVRRGFVKVDGKNVSATAVIGVEFSSAEIGREGKKT